ncbi:MAG: hypothetical protein JWP01_4086 [Myxococcales bacterium]|nr:hypothetical protein [Myxococcales bacterium]
MPRFRSLYLAALLGSLTLGLAASPSFAQAKKAPAAKKAPKAKAPPPPKKKVVPPPSAENKKKLAERMGGFKFGMSKDEVIAVFSKQIAERYDERLKSTTDITAQDRLRKERKAETTRLNASYISFETGKPSPWDVSIVEDELAHGTNEAMMERWENQNGKNERRFFFFYDGKLWKMYISLDVSILPEDKKNFETFQAVMQGQFGPGEVEPGVITWHAGDLDVRAVDKLKSYDAIGLALEDPKVKKDVLALRLEKAPPKKETSSVIKAVIDTEGNDKPDVKSNSNAVDDVIKAQGGSKKK